MDEDKQNYPVFDSLSTQTEDEDTPREKTNLSARLYHRIVDLIIFLGIETLALLSPLPDLPKELLIIFISVVYPFIYNIQPFLSKSIPYSVLLISQSVNMYERKIHSSKFSFFRWVILPCIIFLFMSTVIISQFSQFAQPLSVYNWFHFIFFTSSIYFMSYVLHQWHLFAAIYLYIHLKDIEERESRDHKEQ
jgi:hypothetical protein